MKMNTASSIYIMVACSLLQTTGTLSFSPQRSTFRFPPEYDSISISLGQPKFLKSTIKSSLFMSDVSSTENEDISSKLIGDDSAYFSMEAQV